MKKEEIQNIIKELIEKTTVGVTEISISEEGAKSIWFKVEVKEPHFYTGRDGEALLALNHLVRKMVEVKSEEEEIEFLIDINDFQKKRIDSVKAAAHLMAERARYFKSNIELDPMSPFERRIVHEFLADQPDLKTESVGFGNSRKVVIKYIGTI